MDSKFEKWNELPPEMRYECVKFMDFKSRMQLRGASKSSKSLVESAPKYKFDSVVIDWEGCCHMPVASCMRKINETSELLHGTRESEENGIFDEKGGQLSLQVFKFADIRFLKFTVEFLDTEDFEKLKRELLEYAPFQFKNLILDTANWKLAEFFLKNCVNLETLELANHAGCPALFSLDKLIEIPAVAKVQKLFLKVAQTPTSAGKLVENWIKNDPELGTTFQGGVADINIIEIFEKQFGNRLISKKCDEFRIKTDNSAKHILIRNIPIPFASVAFVSFHVIPANLKESEYEKNDEWVNVILVEQEMMMLELFDNIVANEQF